MLVDVVSWQVTDACQETVGMGMADGAVAGTLVNCSCGFGVTPPHMRFFIPYFYIAEGNNRGNTRSFWGVEK